MVWHGEVATRTGVLVQMKIESDRTSLGVLDLPLATFIYRYYSWEPAELGT